jgi:hypothetical protein
MCVVELYTSRCAALHGTRQTVFIISNAFFGTYLIVKTEIKKSTNTNNHAVFLHVHIYTHKSPINQ